MSRKMVRQKYGFIILIVAILIFLSVLQPSIDKSMTKIRPQIKIDLSTEIGRTLLGETAGFALVSGFKEIAVDILWLRADNEFHSGAPYQVLLLYRLVTQLDPKFVDAWDMAGWHAAYNLYAEALINKRPKEEMDAWIQKGIEIYKDGIKSNPGNFYLYFQLGWVYRDKLKDKATARYWFKKAAVFREHPALWVDDQIQRSYETPNGGIADIHKAYYWIKRRLTVNPQDPTALRDQEWYLLFNDLKQTHGISEDKIPRILRDMKRPEKARHLQHAPELEAKETEPIEVLAQRLAKELKEKYEFNDKKIKEILIFSSKDKCYPPKEWQEERQAIHAH